MGEDFSCPWTEFGSVFLQGFLLGLVLGIVVLIIARKCGLLRRESVFRRALVGIWWFALPLLCGCALSIWMFISYTAGELEAGLEPLREEVRAASVEMAEEVWAEVIKGRPDSPEDLKSLLQTGIRRWVNDDILAGILDSPDLPDVVGVFVEALSGRFAQLVSDQVVRQLTIKAADALSLPPEQLEPLWREGVITALRQGLVLDLLKEIILTPLKALRSKVLLFTGVPLALIALEIVQATWARRRRRVETVAVPA